MTWTIIAVLIIVGFLFLLLEILVLPGTNVAGIIGFALVAVGVWQAYVNYGTMAGTIALGGTLVFSVLALYYSLKSKTWDRASLKTEIDGKVNLVDETTIKPGDKGVAISRLAPMGKAMINGKYFEVKTNGEYVDENTKVRVMEIDHNKIWVEAIGK
jgi:membrane-bound ClpP family serine protease